MELGVTLPIFAGYGDDDEWLVPAERYRRFARRAEELGFGGAWAFDHLTPPPYYGFGACLDPLIALSHAAEATEAIPLGTNILILPLRNPVMVANRAATLQHLSEGRLTLGLGAGYVESEFEAANVPHVERYARFSEGIELLYRLLNEDYVTFDGDFWRVENLRMEPHNARPPRVLAGGTGASDDDGGRSVAEKVMERIHLTDGWIAGPWNPEDAESDWTDIEAYLRDRDADPNSYDRALMTFTHLFPNLDSEESRDRQRTLVERYSHWGYAKQNYSLGSVEDVRERLRAYEEIGFEEVVLTPITPDLHQLDRQLELWAELLLPEFH